MVVSDCRFGRCVEPFEIFVFSFVCVLLFQFQFEYLLFCCDVPIFSLYCIRTVEPCFVFKIILLPILLCEHVVTCIRTEQTIVQSPASDILVLPVSARRHFILSWSRSLFLFQCIVLLSDNLHNCWVS
jgi:hypothetical protein